MKNILKVSLDESPNPFVNFTASLLNLLALTVFCVIGHGVFLYSLISCIKFLIMHFGVPFGLNFNWIFEIGWKSYLCLIILFEMHYSNYISKKADKKANEYYKGV